MFESKRVMRDEQVLVIDDAELTGITSSGKDKGFVVNFVMEREGVETHLHVHLSRSHIEAIKEAQILTVPQLRAVHAKAAKAEEVSKESPKSQAPEVEIVEVPKNTPVKIETKVTVLEPGPAEQVNWKDPKLKTPPKRQQESRRLSNKEVEEMMHQVFRWFTRWRHNKSRNRNYSSLERYLHVTLPNQFGITLDVAKGIYRGDKYRNVSGGYRNQWGIFIHNLKKSGIESELPFYLLKKYS